MRLPVPSSRRSRRRTVAVGLAGAVALAMPGAAVAHELDHPADGFNIPNLPLSTTFNSDTAGEGDNLGWELVTTIPTGNPHTDLDFFTQDGETFASVGTLGSGANGGGQTIVQLTETDEGGEQTVDPSFLSAHPSAFCPTAGSITGLQHDVEATPKSPDVINNSAQQPGAPAADADAQLLVDATDANGRCHDRDARGGLEIVDISNIEDPVEIGLTSHIGESHTVNIDPRRPHIAYSVTSDAVAVSRDVNDNDKDGNVEELFRQNEDPRDGDRFDLDGFEVVDLSTCMNVNDRATFAEDAEVDLKREGCRPEVFRYRYPTLDMSLGHAAEEQTRGNDPVTGAPNVANVYGCHELEVYPDDRLTCAGGSALLTFDMAGAFNDNGTPDDFTDDRPNGQALPCRPRPSSTDDPIFDTGATVIDCVQGGTDAQTVDLTVPNWLAIGAPSLEGVKYTGTVYHQGRAAGEFDVKQDIDFNHETELTQSGKNLIATDERGGGVVPPGATCDQPDINQQGNGGVHAYQVDELRTTRTADAEEAFQAYNVGTDGEKAIFRAPIRTGVEGTFCTAHVMQQAPGQNRVFMGWYTQGTQVIDYVELPNGVFEWVEDADAQQEAAASEDGPAVRAQAETEQAGYFIPEQANTWVSHIFRSEENDDGTFTYFGATGDFILGEDGRNSIDVYKVTLPAPATACTLAPDTAVTDRNDAAEVHRDAIDCVLHYGISKGKTDTTYAPLANVTREQMASFVVNEIKAAGAGDKLRPGGADEFTDIGTSFHRDAINQLQRAGIVQGVGGGAFNPGAQISRQQMAAFMVNAARFITGEPYNAASLNNFSDVPANDIHARNINAGFEAGLFQGTVAPTAGKPGVYSPKIDVRRDQMASFLRNLFLQTIQV